MQAVFLTIWDFLNYEWNYGQFTFSLWNVIEAGFVLSIIGFAIGKIIFFVNEKR